MLCWRWPHLPGSFRQQFPAPCRDILALWQFRPPAQSIQASRSPRDTVRSPSSASLFLSVASQLATKQSYRRNQLVPLYAAAHSSFCLKKLTPVAAKSLGYYGAHQLEKSSAIAEVFASM